MVHKNSLRVQTKSMDIINLHDIKCTKKDNWSERILIYPRI